MSKTEPFRRDVFLRANPTPYDYRVISSFLIKYMQEDTEFSNIVQQVFKTLPDVTEIDSDKSEWLEYMGRPYAAQFIHFDTNRYQALSIIQLCTFGVDQQLEEIWRRSSAILSCSVQDLSGGNVKIALGRRGPEAIPLVDHVWAMFQMNWPNGEFVEDAAGVHSPQKMTIAERKRGPTIRMRERAEIFSAIKNKWPALGYDAVAGIANEQESTDLYTGETVRNTYRSMGWEWDRGDRIR